jgi:hypothetical protein
MISRGRYRRWTTSTAAAPATTPATTGGTAANFLSGGSGSGGRASSNHAIGASSSKASDYLLCGLSEPTQELIVALGIAVTSQIADELAQGISVAN